MVNCLVRAKKNPTHLVTRSFRNEVFCVSSKGESYKRSELFLLRNYINL